MPSAVRISFDTKSLKREIELMSGKQLLFDDVRVGMAVPTLVKPATSRQLVMWAGAANDYYEIHYDKDFAIKTGLKGVIVHGWLTFSFMAQLITDWIGDEGTLKKINCSYRGMHVPWEDVFLKGKVTGKYSKDGENYVECDFWAENVQGKITTPGTAVFTLPAKGK